MGARYGGLKQAAGMGPHGETLLEYALHDARAAGFSRVVLVLREELAAAFRETIETRFAREIETVHAYQKLADLPEGFEVPEGRQKPWGTAHAVWAAREQVRGPFAVINADDFYGREAFGALAGFLRRPSETDARARFCLVGYRLAKTLSPHGTVSRGHCLQDTQGQMQTIRELTKIATTPDGPVAEEGDAKVPLDPRTIVSMNCFGFTPAIFAAMAESFPRFLRQQGTGARAEWYLPVVVSEMLAAGRATVQVLPTEADWMGVTYPQDAAAVKARLAALSQAGHYPTPLWSANS